jgi:hypothetical protein
MEDASYTIREYTETCAVLRATDRVAHPETTSTASTRKPNGERITDRYMDQAGKGFYASGESQLQETYARRYDRFGSSALIRMEPQEWEDAIHALKAASTTFEGCGPPAIAASCKELIVELRSTVKVQRTRNDEKDAQEGVEPGVTRSITYGISRRQHLLHREPGVLNGRSRY